MKLKHRLGWLILLCCIVVIYVSVNFFLSWRSIDQALAKTTYLDKVAFSINKLEQQTYLYRESQSAIAIEQWIQHHQQLSKLLETAPALTPQQQTFQNSIEKHNEGLRTLFDAVLTLQQTDRAKALKRHLLDKLIAKMQTIREDSRAFSVQFRQHIIDILKEQVMVVVPILLLGFCLVAVMALSLTRWLHRSLTKLRTGFDSLGKGNLGQQFSLVEQDDFRQIYEQFNDMSMKLFDTTVCRDQLQLLVDQRTAVLEKLANTDPLTQVATRRLLFDRGNIEFSRAQRQQQALSIMMIDCDYFKSINDKYGHNTGDQVLIYLCQLFKKEIRDIDLLCRFGGEEFVIILPSTDSHDAEQVGKRIQARLEEHPFVEARQRIPLTISIGLTSYRAQHCSFEQMVDEADAALFEAKDNGRNRMEIAAG